MFISKFSSAIRESLERIRIIMDLASSALSFLLFGVDRFTNLLSEYDRHFFNISWRFQVSFETTNSFHLGIFFWGGGDEHDRRLLKPTSRPSVF